MATETFDRRIEIRDPESIKKLVQIIEEEAPTKVLSDTPFSTIERDRSERLLKKFLSRSKA